MNPKTLQLLRLVVVKMTGVFVLNFFGGSSACQAGAGMENLNISYAHAFAIGVAVVIGLPISGAHYNPVVTVCGLLLGAETLQSGSILILGQLLGSFLSGVALKYSQPEPFKGKGLGYPNVPEGTSLPQAFFFETIGTFFLIFAIFAVVRAGYNHFVITLVVIGVLFCIINSIGPLGQCALNPARTLGPALLSDEGFFIRGWWIYYTASFLGGILGMLFAVFIIEVTPSDGDDSYDDTEEIQQKFKNQKNKWDTKEQLSHQADSSWQSDTVANFSN